VSVEAVITLLGGIGLFLLGIHHLTEGLRGLAGDSLRRALQRLAAGPFSAVASGAVFTAVIQSSTAAILTVIGFVSAGLMTFPESIGVMMGATLGTTSTPWLLAIFGFRLRIALIALPIVGVGALLWMVARGKLRSTGATLAGFGLLFVAIDFMQAGMEGVSFEFAGRTGPASILILFGIGVVMTIVMQSSTAAAATTLVALNAGSLTFMQACAMIVGQSVGTTATSALVMIGGSLAVRRAALAHILFSSIVGVLGLLFLQPLAAAADWVGGQLDDPDGVLALAAFSTIFKFAGIAVFFPFIDRFAGLLTRLVPGAGSESAVEHLEPAVAAAGAPVAFEAARRAILELSRSAIDATRRSLAGDPVTYEPPVQSVEQIESFLEGLRLETTDLATIGPRLVRLTHALDHLRDLHEYLTRIPPPPGRELPRAFEFGAGALADWLGSTQDANAPADPAVHAALEDASDRLSVACRRGREATLEDLALQRAPAVEARAALATFAWSDRALYHAWRLAASLRTAAGS